jgi:hypothetical protein
METESPVRLHLNVSTWNSSSAQKRIVSYSRCSKTWNKWPAETAIARRSAQSADAKTSVVTSISVKTSVAAAQEAIIKSSVIERG